jgi:AcrR family transcriptional regulator
MNTLRIMNDAPTRAASATDPLRRSAPRPEDRPTRRVETPSDAPPEARPDTRRRLIAAGVRLFGLHGYEATSTRQLAAAAGVNLAAIPYHFHGKEGLYRAVMQHVVDARNAVLSPYFERLQSLCADPAADREPLVRAMRDMIRAVADDILGSNEAQDACQIMIQEQIAPTPAFDILYEGLFRQALCAWTSLVARLTGRDAAHPDTALQAVSLLGQIMIFRVGAVTVTRHLDNEVFTPDRVRRIADMVAVQAEACLTAQAAHEAGA